MKLFQIQNRVGTVKLNDAVTPWSTDDLIEDLEKLYGNTVVEDSNLAEMFHAKAEDALETVEMEINSPGGSVLDGYRVYHAIKSMQERGVTVNATVNGIAASMASVIICAADSRAITDGSRIMIHEASQTVSGNSADHARAAKTLDEMSGEIAAIYSKVTGSDMDEMRQLMKEETWMGAKESLERGFVDSIKNETIDETPENDKKNPETTMSLLDKLRPDPALQAKLESVEADFAAQTAELEEAKALISGAAEEIAALEARLAETEAAGTEMAKQSAEIAATLATREAELAAAKESAGVVATEMLAEAAHPPVSTDMTAEGDDKIDAYSQYKILAETKPAAAARFWEENKEEILKQGRK